MCLLLLPRIKQQRIWNLGSDKFNINWPLSFEYFLRLLWRPESQKKTKLTTQLCRQVPPAATAVLSNILFIYSLCWSSRTQNIKHKKHTHTHTHTESKYKTLGEHAITLSVNTSSINIYFTACTAHPLCGTATWASKLKISGDGGCGWQQSIDGLMMQVS